MNRGNQFNFDGDNYELRDKLRPAKIKRKTMFDKDYVTLELILFCLGCAGSFAGLLYGLLEWFA
jgi:hypothetical protein